jgi:uncharacterized membrane protein
MFKRYLFVFLSVLIFLSIGQNVFARDLQDITDWYIKDFQTKIVVNKDSSLLITEDITADCGNLVGKHGIFRILPTQIKTESGIYKTPIQLMSIVDGSGEPYKYETINDSLNHTITWKIGDPNITVSGENNYKITYKVKNAVRFGNKDFDELYWNLLGDYWQIDIDNFTATINFPSEINQSNAKVDYYTGVLGSKSQGLAISNWTDDGLYFESVMPIHAGNGITASITFPKNIFTPYSPTFWEKYGDYFWYIFLLIPLGVFVFAFLKWIKYGKDPKMKKPIPPEFGIPDDLTPMQMGMVLSHGVFKNNFITATIIDLAVRKFITIEQIENKIFFIKTKDILLRKNKENYFLDKLTDTEKLLLDMIFGPDDTEKISDLKKNLYRDLPEIKKSAKNNVIKNGWMAQDSAKYAIIFLATGAGFMWLSFWAAILSGVLFWSIFSSGFILVIFAWVMPKRTQAGVDLLFRIKGFELYMKQAENFRQQFYEKENIFDKFLPYAIIFGITKSWAKKMELIYGKDYFNNYHPIWLSGFSPTGNFDLNSFTSQLNSISSSISSATGVSSGAGGGGSSGGGGGGGGGGGW